MITQRPICYIDGCTNLARCRGKRKDGSRSYRKECDRHMRLKYGIKLNKINSAKRRQLKNMPNLDCSKCALCGWDKATCDRHRIKFGRDGGTYTLGNIMVVCPNCHCLIHRGLLVI